MFKKFEIFDINERLNYDNYHISLNDNDFINYYKSECNQWDIRNIHLSRSIITENEMPEMMLVDASKHELTYPDSRKYNYILYHVIDKSKLWGNIPNKYRSIYYFHASHSNVGNNLKKVHYYYVLPTNNAILANNHGLIGQYMKFINNDLQRRPSYFFKEINDFYKIVFNEEINYDNSDTTIGCLNKLSDELVYSYSEYSKNNTAQFLRNNIIKYEKPDLVSFLDFCFEPKKNEFKLVNKDYCKTDRSGYYDYQIGWTDSKILMIKEEYLKNILKKL